MQVPKFRFVLVDGGYIGEKEASQFLSISTCFANHPPLHLPRLGCGRTFHYFKFPPGKGAAKSKLGVCNFLSGHILHRFTQGL